MYDSACRDFQKRMHFLVSDMLLTWLRLSPISTADVDLIRLGFLVLLLCSGLASSRGCNQLNKQFLISTPHQFSSSLFRRNLSRRLLLLAVMSVQNTFINATINLISVFFFFFFLISVVSELHLGDIIFWWIRQAITTVGRILLAPTYHITSEWIFLRYPTKRTPSMSWRSWWWTKKS